MMNRIAKLGGVFKIRDAPESPKKGACLRNVMNRNRQMRPNEGACLRYVMNRNRQTRWRV